MSSRLRGALLANPHLEWSVERACADKAGLLGVGVFALLFYGALGLVALGMLQSNAGASPWTKLLQAVHWLTWSTCAAVLLLWAPPRLAQRLARERERGTLESLRLTGLSGLDLAVGHAAGSLVAPLLAAAATAPAALLGGLGVGPLPLLRGYPVLLLLCVVYTLAGGIVGLTVKKAQQVGSSVVLGVCACLGLGGTLKLPGLSALGALGPWGAVTASVEGGDGFWVTLLGARLPGEALQVPLLVLVGAGLLLGLARRLDGEPAALLGRTGSLALAGAVVAGACLTYVPDRSHGPSLGLTAEVVLVLVAALVAAPEMTVTWRDLVRGLCRRLPDDPPFPEERLSALHVTGPGLLLIAGGALLLGLRAPGADAAPLVVATLVAATAWTEATWAMQAATLWSRDRGAPRVIAALGIGILWFGPLLSSAGLQWAGAPQALAEAPRILCPFPAILAAFAHGGRSATAFDPLALGLGCAIVHGVLTAGLVLLVRTGVERARALADSLVVLPADADAPPGALERRCPQGHLFAAAWAVCPHCHGREGAAGAPSSTS